MFESSKLAGRSLHAIGRQLKRLPYVRYKKSHGGHVNADDVAELDEIIKNRMHGRVFVFCYYVTWKMMTLAENI